MKRTRSADITWHAVPVLNTLPVDGVKRPVDFSCRILGKDRHGLGVVLGRVVFKGWVAVSLDGAPVPTHS